MENIRKVAGMIFVAALIGLAAYFLGSCVMGCGGSTNTTDVIVGGTCEVVQDCDIECPTGYSLSCEAELCLCTGEVEVEVPVEIPVEVEVPVGCEADSECCNELGTYYKGACQESGVCYCVPIDQECYALIRGEFAEQLMEKYLGEDWDDYVPSIDPYFSDVPTGHEFFKPVQAAVEFGILDGYSDGTFGPYDHLNRAEISKATIMAVDGLIGYTPPSQSSYYDVGPTDWFYVYVEAATDYGWTRGYVDPTDGTPTGYFGPGDVASSCFMDAMMARAEFPLNQTGGTLTVTLASTSPPGQTIAWNAPPEPHLATFNFSASDGDVYIDSLVVTRGGVGQGSDWNKLLLMDLQNNLLAQNQVEDFYEDTNTFHVHLFIPAGETRTLKLTGTLFEFATIGNQSYFSIASPSDITSNAVSVVGDFPVSGATFVIVPAITVTEDSTPTTTATAGSANVELLNYRITSVVDVMVRDTYFMVSLADEDNDTPSPAPVPVPAVLSHGNTNSICAIDLSGIAKADTIKMETTAGTEYAVVKGIITPTQECPAGTIWTALPTFNTIVGEVIEVEPFDFLTNLRVVDRDTGTTLVSPYFTVPYEDVATEDYELEAGQPRNLSLQVDILHNMPAGYRIQGGVRYSDGQGGDSYFSNMAANIFVPANHVLGAVDAVQVGPVIPITN